MSSTESKLSTLHLVYPPMSNQEAHWLARDPAVEQQLRQSDFYMICGRAEAKFRNFVIDEDAGSLSFDFTIGETFSDSVSILIHELPGVVAASACAIEVEAGEKLIRIWNGPAGNMDSEVLDWFTTEALLFAKSRGRSGITGFDRYRDAYTYDLLYVGIAKVGDSYDRLIAKGHKARMDILSNEPQRLPNSRVTDETFLFLFKVEPLFITTFDAEHDFEDEDFCSSIALKRVVVDAEKAFVSLLDPKYNGIKYNSYPKGKDGLYNAKLTRYCYVVAENITFNAPNGRFRGSWTPLQKFISNSGDSIFVEGDQVELFLSGVHYPDESDGVSNTGGD